MSIQIITEKITRAEVKKIGGEWYPDMVKGVVDVKREVIALGGEYHMDANHVLLADGSEQRNVWGFNIYPDRTDGGWIEFRSLINIRPAQGSRSMVLKDVVLCGQMRAVIEKLIV